MILDEWIDGTPRPQGNPQQITKHYSRYPSTTIEHRNELVRNLREVWSIEPLDRAVNLYARFYFTRPKSHYRTGRNSHILKDTAPAEHIQTPDVDKLIRLVSDALTIAGVLDDDSRISLELGEKLWTEGPAGTHIEVELR